MKNIICKSKGVRNKNTEDKTQVDWGHVEERTWVCEKLTTTL